MGGAKMLNVGAARSWAITTLSFFALSEPWTFTKFFSSLSSLLSFLDAKLMSIGLEVFH